MSAKIIPIRKEPEESLHQNLKRLEELHERLKKMLVELEELVREDE